MAKIPLPIGTYQYESPRASARKLVNCTADQAPVDGKSAVVLRRMPGIDSWAIAGSKLRGGHRFKGKLYVVSGTVFYKVEASGTATALGDIPGNGLVSIADNGLIMCIVAEPNAYISTGSSVSQITDPDYRGAVNVDYIDTYFVFTDPDTQILFSSELLSTDFAALDFTSADSSPDDLVGLIVDHQEIFLAGEDSCELWYDAGNPTGSPFSRSPGGVLEVGCASAKTLAKIDNSIFWLADDHSVRRLVGRNPAVISTPGIAKFLKDISGAYAFEYTFEDKFYYVLTIGGITIEYDIRAGEWHNRESRNKDFWSPIQVIDVYGYSVILDGTSGKIGRLNSDTRTEWGDIQLVNWTYQPISTGKRIFHDRLEIDMDTGVGLITGQGSDPKLMLFISDDGGHTFTEYLKGEIGAIGNYQERVMWNNLGSAYNRVYRCEVSDPVDILVADTNVEIREGVF